MSDRTPVPKKIRFEVFKRDSFTCQYCGRPAPTVVLHLDHIQPVSKDGDNGILNLITSCVDCNLGKTDTLLTDDAAIQKQKAQLDELQERREQIEMMLDWRNGLKTLTNDAVQAAVDAFDKETPGWTTNDNGRKDIAKLVKTFGLQQVLDAIDVASAQYLEFDDDDLATNESVDLAFNKLGGICRLQSQPDWKRALYYLRGILRNRLQYFNDWQGLQILENAYHAGVPLGELRWIATNVTTWTRFKAEVDDSTERVQKEQQEENG